MYTSVAIVALSGFLLPSAAIKDEPNWLKEYDSARKQVQKEDKPLVVFIGSGKSGWDQVSQEGKLGKEIKTILAKNYVCLYVDLDKKAGKQLAKDFELKDGPGLIISNSTGSHQAFRHEGDLDNHDLAWYLREYSDPELTVEHTETAQDYISQTEQERTTSSQPRFNFLELNGASGGRSC